MIAFSQVGRPRWTPRRYDALAEEGFRRNVVAWKCISTVARAASSIPFVLYDESGAELEKHPLLALLQKPNPLQSGSRFLESVFAYYQISGNAYVEAVRPGAGEPPRELYALRPDRMKVVPAEGGVPGAYHYAVGSQAASWPCDPVTGESSILHWKAFHPLDDWYGMAPLEAAMAAIDQHNAAASWNQALLAHAARPSGALVYAPKDGPAQLTDEQFRRLKEELEENYLSSRNAGRPLILEGGLEWKEMGLTPKDMDWLAGKNRAASDIALAFGVPDQLIGIQGAQTYANMAEARLALYEDTVLPLALQLRDEMNRFLSPMFGAGLRLDIDKDEVPALVHRRDALWEKVGGADFLSLNEKRAALGYPPVENGDELQK
ncbi:MAG: phage portal protein [Proteobacteria bacterium]|nr:phage portal protein [Pseudomonadota bacterium]